MDGEQRILSSRERAVNAAFDTFRKSRRDLAGLAVEYVTLHLKAQGLEALTEHEGRTVRAAVSCDFALPFGWAASEREVAPGPSEPDADPTAPPGWNELPSAPGPADRLTGGCRT